MILPSPGYGFGNDYAPVQSSPAFQEAGEVFLQNAPPRPELILGTGRP